MKSWVTLCLAMASLLVPGAEPREARWREVQAAIENGLPQTAIEAIEPIVAEAIADRAWGEAIKAIGRRTALESQIEGRKPEAVIQRLASELERAPTAIQPVLHTLLANAYWGYFRQNQWRFAQRTAAGAASGADFTTWDLRRLFAEIDRHFQGAIQNAAVLRATPISDFDALLEKGTVPDSLRPTLYDFLARQALEFYQAGEQGLSQPEEAFVVSAEGPALGSVDEFLAWQPTATASDTNSPTLAALRLYQDLLRHHRSNPDPSPRLAADIERLTFAHRVASGPAKDERFVTALIRLANLSSTHELSARARQAAARLHQANRRLAEAHRLAREAADAFPESIWTRDSRNLIAEIEAPHIAIATEYAWNAPLPTLDVEHRNIPRIWFRAVRADWAQYLDRRLPRPERLNRRQRLDLLAQPPVLEWSADLPPTPDFRQRRQSLPAPTTLAPGFYFLFASHQPDFAQAANELSVATIWVSELALVLRPSSTGIEGFVLDANSGEPRPGATVEAWFLAPNGNRTAIAPRTTDALGSFRFDQPRDNRGHLIRATLGSQQIALSSDFWWHPFDENEERRATDQTLVLTDRALYRPGQVIQYKGIAFHLDPGDVRYELRARREITVVFRDANDQEITRRTHRSSDLGSFSGSFDAPRDRLTGRMSISVEGAANPPAWIQVEEYKRPKFQVVLDPPTQAPRLNETVQVKGRALSYTGAAIDRAKVTWRVQRQTRFPIHWGFFRPGPGRGAEQEIAHGTAETDAEGSFEFRFRALADPAALEADEPVFNFLMHADVTDSAGETRSADRTIPIGYAAVTARLEANAWQETGKAVALRITTESLDGQPQTATGTVRIHRLEQPSIVHRPRLRPIFPEDPLDPVQAAALIDLSNPLHWKLADSVASQPFQTATNGMGTNRFELAAGFYQAVLETQDRFGQKVTSRLPLRILDPNAEHLGVNVPHHFEVRDLEMEPGGEFVAVWGTGYNPGRAFVEIQHRNRPLERYWTTPGRTQQRIQIAITEALRGGFSVTVTQVRENRAYVSTREIQVPWKNKELELTWETFRSKLEPGQKETWTARIKPIRPGSTEAEAALRTATEIAATLYDASLDQFLEHRWPSTFEFWPRFTGRHYPTRFSNEDVGFEVFQTPESRPWEDAQVRYREFPSDLQFENLGRMMPRMMSRFGGGRVPASAAPAMLATAEMAVAGDLALFQKADAAGAGGAQPAAATLPPPPLAQVTPRRNLNETAFFLPTLASDSNGFVRVTFTVPEALTEWRFFGFAHDKDLRSGSLSARAVTAKEIMVQPNPPRFLREGDEFEFSVKVLNQSDVPQAGRVRLTFDFAHDQQSADAALDNAQPELPFEIPARESRSLAWRIKVPDGCRFLTYKAVAATARHSDGEEGFLPVLARRVLVTESLPLPIRGPGQRTFEFASLRNAAQSPTLRHHAFSVQMASQPAWYAVLALPYLMEYPHEGSEQVFNRYYANALARHIASSDPRIRRIFDQWRNTAALDSPLEKNPDLKSVALAETPWVREARSESEARRNVGILFDANRLDAESSLTLRKLEELLLPEGAWPWFPGGPRNDFISLYIVGGFGRLRQLGVEVPMEIPLRALPRMDSWMVERYEDLKERKQLDRQNIDAAIGLYLYARSFFLKDMPVPDSARESIGYWMAQGREYWLKTDRQTQAHLALAFTRFGNASHHDALGTAQAIAKSLKEHSRLDQELGRSWAEEEPGWRWHRAPIETQALMIEVFQVVTGDTAAAEECRVWLLKQKQTQNWKSTKATADAVYAILLGGPSLLGSDALVHVQLASRDITPVPGSAGSDPANTPEPGTGFYQVRIPSQEIRPELATLTVIKSDAGIAWGSAHWQYFEDLSRIRPFAGTPLQLAKAVFTRIHTAQGPRLQPVTGPVQVGDELLVRIELRVDREMEFIHLKDLRGSGTEPVNVLSRYTFQDGLGYYESTRDTASHFFIENLPKGTYVFEYPLRVQHRGTFPTGVAEVQCLYAPEFNSHSASVALKVN